MRSEGWQRSIAALWVAQMLTMVGFSFIFPFIPLYIQTLGVKGTTEAAQWAGVIGAGSALSMAVAQPIWGNVADRWGRKPMVIRSLLGNGIVMILMGLASSPEQLLILRFVQGAVTGTIAAANALVSTTTPRHRLGFALGIMQVAVFVGASIGPLVGGLIADAFSYRLAFYISGSLMLLGVPVVLAFVREHREQSQSQVPNRGVLAESRLLMAIAAFPAMIGVIFLLQLGTIIVTPVLSLFVAELSGGANAATSAGAIIAATGAMSAMSALVIGRLGDRVGHTPILWVCLLGAAIAYFPQAIVQQVWQLLLLRLLLGMFLGGLMPSANALVAGMVPPERRGAAFGLLATATAMANALGPISGAGVATQWGIRAVFLATGGLYTAGWGWVTFTFRNRRAPRGTRGTEGLALERDSDERNSARPHE